MAEEPGVSAGAVPSKKRRMIIIAVAGLVVAGSLGVALQMLLEDEPKPPAKPMAQAAKPAAQPAAPQAAAAQAPAVPPAAGDKPAAAAPKPAAAPASVAAAAPQPAAGSKPAPAAEQPGAGRIVIPGTYRWDAKTNSVGTGGDVLWQQRSEKERALNPQGRASIAIAVDQAYESMGPAEVVQLSYSSTPIPGNDGMTALDPGAVLGLRTADGEYLKMRVARYYDSHDFTFRGGEKLPETLKKSTRSRPKVERYNIELEWFAFPAPATATALRAALARKPAAPAAAMPEKVAAAPSEAASKPDPDSRAEVKPKPVAVLPPRPTGPSIPGPRYNDLTTAVMYRDTATVAELIAMGKWVDRPDSQGRTPLMTAVTMEDMVTAEVLLKAGANADRGMSAARESRNQSMQALMKRYGAR